MDYFPMFVDVRGQRAVVVGGGGVAARKVESLLRAGAQVHVVAPVLGTALEELSARGAISSRRGHYEASDLAGARVVIAATDVADVNTRVSQDARRAALLVNVVDQPALSTFIVPAVVDRAPVVIAVSSAGAAPVLARTLRGKLEAWLPQGYAQLAALCATLRHDVKVALPDVGARRAFWERALESKGAELALRGELVQAEAAWRELLGHAASRVRSAEVICIGTGPGDPDLVSFRAQRAMLRAGVVFHTQDVAPGVLDLCRRDAPRVLLKGALPDALLAMRHELEACTARGDDACVLARGDAFRERAGAEAVQRLAGLGLACVVVPGVV